MALPGCSQIPKSSGRLFERIQDCSPQSLHINACGPGLLRCLRSSIRLTLSRLLCISLLIPIGITLIRLLRISLLIPIGLALVRLLRISLLVPIGLTLVRLLCISLLIPIGLTLSRLLRISLLIPIGLTLVRLLRISLLIPIGLTLAGLLCIRLLPFFIRLYRRLLLLRSYWRCLGRLCFLLLTRTNLAFIQRPAALTTKLCHTFSSLMSFLIRTKELIYIDIYK